jgi:hypothetical protein
MWRKHKGLPAPPFDDPKGAGARTDPSPLSIGHGTFRTYARRAGAASGRDAIVTGDVEGGRVTERAVTIGWPAARARCLLASRRGGRIGRSPRRRRPGVITESGTRSPDVPHVRDAWFVVRAAFLPRPRRPPLNFPRLLFACLTSPPVVS